MLSKVDMSPVIEQLKSEKADLREKRKEARAKRKPKLIVVPPVEPKAEPEVIQQAPPKVIEPEVVETEDKGIVIDEAPASKVVSKSTPTDPLEGMLLQQLEKIRLSFRDADPLQKLTILTKIVELNLGENK